LGLADEPDNDSGPHDSDLIDGMEMLIEQLEDEDIVFDLQMYEALSGSQLMQYH